MFRFTINVKTATHKTKSLTVFRLVDASMKAWGWCTEVSSLGYKLSTLCFAGCGVSVVKQQGAQRRIVGGDEAGFGSFPWQVRCSIMYFNYNSKLNPGFRVLLQSVGFCNDLKLKCFWYIFSNFATLHLFYNATG